MGSVGAVQLLVSSQSSPEGRLGWVLGSASPIICLSCVNVSSVWCSAHFWLRLSSWLVVSRLSSRRPCQYCESWVDLSAGLASVEFDTLRHSSRLSNSIDKLR